MTVTSSVNKQFYTGNGSVTTFAINSLSGDVLTGLTIFDDDDVKVYLDGVLKTKTTHYTISSTTPPASFAGKLVNANVVFLTAPANGAVVSIIRDIPVTQDLQLSNGNNVPPKPLESQLDKIVVQNQQLAGTLGVDVVRIGGFESASGINPITIENDKYLKWVGGQLTNADPIAIGVDISNATVTQVATNTANIATILQKGVSPWVSSRAYVAGDVAGYSNNVWIALASNTNSAPTDVNANWVRVATRTGTIYALPTNHHDLRINYTDANTITVLAGSRVRSSDDTTDIVFSADRTCVLNASGSNGLDTGTESANTWYNLYAIYNPSTLTSALLFSTVNEAVSGSITLPSGFTKKRQLKFSVRNDGSSNILPFRFVDNNKVLYRDVEEVAGYAVLSSGGSTTFTAVSTSSLVPPTSRLCTLYAVSPAGSFDSGEGCWTRETGTSITTGKKVTQSSFSSGNWRGPDTNTFEQTLNTSQQYDYRVVGSASSHYVQAYIVTEVL
jgi:hypothetical protein